MQTERSLVKKMSSIMREVKYIQKKGYNSHNKYNYIREEDVLEGLREKMADSNLMIFQELIEKDVTQSGATKSGAAKFLTTITMKYTIVDGDSGEERVISSGGQGEDSGDKGIYKATTGANKYALLKLFMIPTGDDPELDGGSQQQNGNQNKGNQQQQKPNQQPQQQQKAPKGPSAIDVENQGLTLNLSFTQLMDFINALRKKNGAPPVKDVFEMDQQWITAVYSALDKRIKGGK